MNSEKGQVLPLALLALSFGSLVITSFVGYTNNTLMGSRVYGEAIAEQYSADAGVEYAIWHLQKGESMVPGFTINNDTVTVTIENQGGQIYIITSTATSDDGSSTIIEAIVSVTAATGIPDGYATFPDGFTIEDDTYIGNVYVEGDLTLIDQSKIIGNVIVTGDVYLDDHCTITETICAGGNVYLVDQCTINLNIYAQGDVYLSDHCTINGDVYVYAAENIHLSDGSVINGDYPLPYVICPLFGVGDVNIQTWQITCQRA